MAARALFVLLLTACSSFAFLSHAFAQAPESYEGWVKDALEAQNQGDFERAHQSFGAAHALKPNARTLRGMGVASFQAGHPSRALSELEAALAHPEKPLDAELRSAVVELLTRVRAQLGTVSVKITPEGARVRVDDATESAAVDAPLLLDPGSYTLHFEAAGHVSQSLGIDVAAGTSQTVRVTLSPESAARAELVPPQIEEAPSPVSAPPAQAEPRVRDRPVSKPHRRRLLAAYTLGSLSAGAGLTWIGLKLTGKYVRMANVRDFCLAQEGGRCEDEAQRDAKARSENLPRFQRALVATGIVTGAAAMLGIGLFTWDYYAEGKRFSLELSAQGVELTGRF